MASSTSNDLADLKKLCDNLRRTLTQSSLTQQQTPATVTGPSFTSRTRTNDSEGGRYNTDEPLSLGLATVNRMSGEPDAAHKQGIKEWNEWYEQHKDVNVDDWKASEMINLAGIMSKIFFLDELRFPVKFEWQKDLATHFKLGEERKIYGSAAHANNGDLEIRMQSTDHHKEKKMDNHVFAIISTFLHELTHCYLFSFCCDGVEKHTQSRCSKGGNIVWPMSPQGKSGGNGHCLGWFLAASKISVQMESWLGIKGHLFPLRSFIGYCREIRSAPVGDWTLFFSLFSPDEVALLFGHLHDDRKEKAGFGGLLKGDPAVAKLWADWGKEHLK